MEEFSRGHKKVQIPLEASNSAHSSPITIFEFDPGLVLMFSNGHRLTILDSYKEYESYDITRPGQTIIV